MYVLLKKPIFLLSGPTISLESCCLTLRYCYIHVVWRFLNNIGFFFGNLRPKILGVYKVVKIQWAVITSSVYLTKIFFYHDLFDSYIRKIEKMLIIADFGKFGPKYLGPQIFPRHAVCGTTKNVWILLTRVPQGAS